MSDIVITRNVNGKNMIEKNKKYSFAIKLQ